MPGTGRLEFVAAFRPVPLGATVAQATTLMKITIRCGPAAVYGLNEPLLAKASAARLFKTNRARADTTVVGSNVAYRPDSGLLARMPRPLGGSRPAGIGRGP